MDTDVSRGSQILCDLSLASLKDCGTYVSAFGHWRLTYHFHLRCQFTRSNIGWSLVEHEVVGLRDSSLKHAAHSTLRTCREESFPERQKLNCQHVATRLWKSTRFQIIQVSYQNISFPIFSRNQLISVKDSR